MTAPLNKAAEDSRTPKSHGWSGTRGNAPASWSAAVLCRFLRSWAIATVLSSARIVLFTLIIILSPSLFAQHRIPTSVATNEFIAPASNQGELAIKRFQSAPWLKVDLWAAEPMLAIPVAF